MGAVKQQWQEVQDRGYDFSDLREKHVCANHFEDAYLKKYILKHAELGICSYCGKRGKVTNAEHFMEHIANKICDYYGNPDNEDLPLGSSFYDDDKEEIPGIQRMGCFAVPTTADVYMSTMELFYVLDLITDDEILNTDMLNGFINDEWIQHEPFNLPEHQELSWKWESFAQMVMHEQRFTFFKRDEFQGGKDKTSDNGLDDILTELSKRISTHHLYSKIKQGTKLYRSRPLNDGDIVDKFEDITSPPNDIAKQNRMSAAGMSMFYGAFDIKTAIEECRSRKKPKTCAVGEFLAKKELVVLDLTKLPEASFWIDGDRESIWFLNSFYKEITKTIKRDDRIHIEYIPSQVFTEYLRYLHKTPNGRQLDGLKYKSSLPRTKDNIVLFYNQMQSKNILELTKIDTWEL